MDNNFLQNADALIMERHGSIMYKFKTENEKNVVFLNDMAAEVETLKSLVPLDIWLRIDRCIDMLKMHGIILSKYTYIQGIKDCVSLAHYMDSDFINLDFDEFVFN